MGARHSGSREPWANRTMPWLSLGCCIKNQKIKEMAISALNAASAP
jgi:hypothetical protein